MTPYEYFNDQLGVQSKFLVTGRDMDENSIQVIGERGLRHRISKGYIKRLRPNAPNFPMLVSWQTLPPEWHRLLIEKFGEPSKQTKQSWFEKHYQRDTVAFEYFLKYKLQSGHTLPDTVIDEYTNNASVLNTVAKVYSNRYALRRSLRGQVADIWGIVSAECNRFKDIQPHTLPMNAASLRRKLSLYKKEGYQSLIHKNYCNIHARKVDGDVMALLNSMFASQSHKPTATEISRQYDGFLAGYVEVINNVTGELYDPSTFKKLSNTTITNYLSKWINKVGTHTLRSGDRQKWIGRFVPYHSMEAPKYSGSIISIDDRQPPFKMPNDKRPWFYNGVDLASLAITTWVHGTSKDGIILDFYRQMVRNYTEWGLCLPLELEAESSLNSSFKDTFLRPGAMFEHVHISANAARTKRIEPINGILRYEYEKKYPGWIPRHNAKSEPNEPRPGKTPTVPYETIIDYCLRAIWEYNNSEHPEIKGKTRWDVFLDNQAPNLKPTNWRAILPHLGYKTETSCHTGIIRLQSSEFLLGLNGKLAYSEKLISLLDQVEGKDLDIYWIDDNKGKVLKALVYLRGSNCFVCEAVEKPRYVRATAEQTPVDLLAREQISKYAASVTGFINSQKNKIDRVTVNDMRPRVMNTRFEMPGMKKAPSPDFVSAELLPDLPEENDFVFTNNEKSYNKSLSDRY